MVAYYNEIDPYAAEWLRELIKRGHIADGIVDERSIEDVAPDELAGFTQCHFFAGIGVWSLALRRAGWPDDRPVWTGSCPCQPFSAAGKGDGFADERHLWPHFHWLIEQCRPRVVFGEQVASKDGLAWLDLVQADLEGTGYASAAVDVCAAGVGAPHIRQRIWWVAERLGYAENPRLEGHSRDGGPAGREGPSGPASSASVPDGLADVHGNRCNKAGKREPAPGSDGAFGDGTAGRLADAKGQRRTDGAAFDGGSAPFHGAAPEIERIGNRVSPSGRRSANPTNGFWRDADWLFCRDGKWRPVEPGTFPLAHGAPARVGRLRAYGNAIVAQVAEEFISAYLDEKKDIDIGIYMPIVL